ncbi:MAG: hypothetical protein CMN04_06430 [Roseibacillus sp.]|nr:hypothetical protein [Roseibacillus sp.]
MTHERLERAAGRRRIVYGACSIASKTGISAKLIPYQFFLIGSYHRAEDSLSLKQSRKKSLL